MTIEHHGGEEEPTPEPITPKQQEQLEEIRQLTAKIQGSNERISAKLAALTRFAEEVSGQALRAYPDGRIGGEDLGQTAFMVNRLRHPDGRLLIEIQFTHPVKWITLEPSQVQELIDLLTAQLHADP